ncbi:caspase family protein [Spirosoma validum]|uniref:Caspase family protein n=1 Tax=Spirosoma validum TaxID=2771355 RepID=A0A927B484_9BACT|nr:caspase family protein [Spirosoma validum]MBD2754952.1 caspase family protein [Spirosoma validum]
MRYDNLAAGEAAFRKRTDYTFTRFTAPVPGENLTLTGIFCQPKTRSGYFNTPEPPPVKQRILLHFTAGDLSGGINQLTRQNTHISVPFVLARDGTVYQLFPSKYWSGNIGQGIGNTGTNNAQDKVTVSIEIINFGYLVERNGNLETIYSEPAAGQPDTYCKLTQTEAYQKLVVPFRTQRYYATYTPQQYDSLIILLRFLTKKYNIPRVFLDESKRYEDTNDVLNFKGIVSHVNYRGKNKFGNFEKWDIGPAFDWKTLIAGVQAPSYTPKFAQRSLSPNEDVITSEEQMEEMMNAPRGVEVAPPEEFSSDFGTGDKVETVKPKLFALLVGIDKYERFPLGGCVNDMKAMEDYLRHKTGFDHQILTIQDKDATKQAIAKAFRNHLGKASKNDTVLFYFSGHGTQENADPIWTNDTDEGLECIVTYNGNAQTTSDYLVADKELRYLIHDVSTKTGAHVVTMFDCCHSGDNTRSLASEAFQREAETNERRVLDRNGDYFPKRDWNGFLFSDVIPYETAKHKKLEEFLPEGAHVQLSACESDEVALEVGGRGVFTKTLLNVLEKSGGNVSYQSLRSRVRQYMKFGFDQKPKISVVVNPDLLNTIFLNQGVDSRKNVGEMVYNDTKKAWLLNFGAIHGAKADSPVQIVDPQQATKTFPAVVRDVFIDHSVLDTADLQLDQTTVYTVLTDELMVEEVKLFLNNVNGNQADLNPLVEKLLAASGGCYVFEADEATADFTLHINTGQCYVTRPNDPFRPLFMPVQLDDPNKETTLTNALRHMSRRQFVKKLDNTSGNTIKGDLLRIELSQVNANGRETALPVTGKKAKPVYEKIGDKWRGKLKIKVTNQSDRKLYFSAYYLPSDFSVSLDLMNNRVTLLEPGKSVNLSYRNNDEIPLTLERIVREYNWPKSVETLKFLVSSLEFDPEGFVQAGLPLPPLSTDKDKPRDKATRGIGEEEEEPKALTLDFWQTQPLTLEYANPEYNKVSQPWLDTLLSYPPLAEFLFGVYYDVVTDEFGQPKPVLKPELIVPPGERGLLDDAKLWAANSVELWRRNRLYNQVKNSRTRIVAEGDSWFLYPFFVQEILDHLSTIYAVKSLAAAGDTLENYMRSDDYLSAIEEEKPAFYLVSGGGNDILGKQFKDYLHQAADVPPGSAPEAYLKKTISAKLDQLHDWYVQMFDKIRREHPDLPIIFHGYDYPIPVDTVATPDKTSWLGKYMIEKGIGDQALRANIIKYIMDQFNQKMQTLASEQRKIYFIDVRNMVIGSKNWYDEIHPSSASFQTIAFKFVDKMKELA